MAIEFKLADYSDATDSSAIVTLLDEYAQGTHGGGKPLTPFVRENLVATLAETPNAFSVVGYSNGQPIALANCFRGLSTFACQPLINIHDLVVAESSQRQGVSQALLRFIEEMAREEDCCKLTLEVLDKHGAAKDAYTKFGFVSYTLDDHSGHAIFMHKSCRK